MWAQPKEGSPDIIFDKETCCKPPINGKHNLWWVYVQPRNRPSVAGYGKTLETAMTELLEQLGLGPEQWMQKHGAKHEKNLTTEKKSTTAVQKEYFASKAREQSNMAALDSVQRPTGTSSIHATTSVAPPHLQLVKPKFILSPCTTKSPFDTTIIPKPWKTPHFPLMTSTWRSSPKKEVNKSPFDTTIIPKTWIKRHITPNPSGTPTASSTTSFGGFGSATTNTSRRAFEKSSTTHIPMPVQHRPSHNPLISIVDSSVLQEGREKKKRKEADMESGEDEEEWERRDAQKQAQKKARLLPARQVNNPFLSFGSSHHEQARQEAGFLPTRQSTGNRQTPFLFAKSTASFPGVTGSTSNFGTFASTANTPATSPVKVEQPLVFPSSNALRSIPAFPPQTAQTSSIFAQYRSEVSEGPPAGHRLSGPFDRAQAMQDHQNSRSSGSLEGQESQMEVKVEEIGQASPRKIKVEWASCVPESSVEGPAST
jgi:hypothetical protein